jgi:hypothetical protein
MRALVAPKLEALRLEDLDLLPIASTGVCQRLCHWPCKLRASCAEMRERGCCEGVR